MRSPSACPPAYDVAIVGGGPAGASLATLLARAGRRAVVVDRGCMPGRARETIATGTVRDLVALGVPSRLFAPVRARSSDWGAPRHIDEIAVPGGLGALVERDALDEELRDAARCAGAHVLRDHVLDVHRSAGAWTVRTRAAAFRAGLVVDASGRACWVTRRHAGPPVVYDRLVAVTRDGARDVPPFGCAVAAASGGWRFATHAGVTVQTTFYTDVDLLGEPHGRPRSARSQRAFAVTGSGWCAIGDAAGAFDPLSSAGVSTALRDAVDVARAIEGGDSLDAYADRKRRAYIAYLAERRACYGSEPRWAGEPFWARRQARAR